MKVLANQEKCSQSDVDNRMELVTVIKSTIIRVFCKKHVAGCFFVALKTFCLVLLSLC